MTLHKGMVEQLPFAASSFDAALAIDNMHFWRDRLTGFRGCIAFCAQAEGWFAPSRRLPEEA